MKKLLLVSAALVLATPAWSAQQPITTITVPASGKIDLKTYTNTYVNPRITDIDENTTDLYTNKADKMQVVRYWEDWPSSSPGNVLAAGVVVAYEGELYKTTQQFTKTAGATPVGFGAYFTKITGPSYTLPAATSSALGGVMQGTGVSIAADGTLSVTAAGIGLGTSDNPSFSSVHASGGNLAAANKQVTKAWQTGLSYTAAVTSVIHGDEHYIAKTTHTADSTTQPGVGANWETAWKKVSGVGGAAIDDLTDVDTTGKATGKILKFNSSGNLVVGDDSVGSGSVPSGTVNGQVLTWQTDSWVVGTAPWLTTASLGTGVATALGNAVDGTGGLVSKTALDLKANASNISMIIGALADVKILTTAQPANGENWIDDTVAYGATEDNLRLWSIEKTGAELALKANASCFASESAFNACFDLTWGGGSMTYPGAGIPVSNGSAWGTSITPGTGVAAALAVAVDGTGGLASKAALDAISAGSLPVVSDTTPPSTEGVNYSKSDYKFRARHANGDVYASAAMTLEAAADTTPSAFSFTDVTDADLSAEYTDCVQVAGTNWPSAVTSTQNTAICTGDGTGCGTYGTAPGNVPASGWVCAKNTSSSSNSTATNNAVTIGGVSDTFTVTTAAGTSYIINEGFEGTGLPSAAGVTWTNDSGTPNYDYTTTVLSGNESMYITGTNRALVVLDTTYSSGYAVFRLLPSGGTTSTAMFEIRDSSGVLLTIAYSGTNDYFSVTVGASNAVSANSSVPGDAEIFVRVYYAAGTGDAIGRVWLSTNGSSWGDPVVDITNATSSASFDRFRFRSGGGNMIYDNFMVATTEINGN